MHIDTVYDPLQPDYQQNTDLTSHDIIQLLKIVQDKTNESIHHYLRTCPIPTHLTQSPQCIHMLLTANLCHYFTHTSPLPIPGTYQDLILEYMSEIGYESYCNYIRLWHLHPQSVSQKHLFSSILQ